jgi:6-phosphogluconolactonase
MKSKMIYWVMTMLIVCVVSGQSSAFAGHSNPPLNHGGQEPTNDSDTDEDDVKRSSTRSFVYVLTNPNGPNAIDAFVRNRRTGRLTYNGRFFTGGQGNFDVGASQQHSLISDGRYVYAVNPGSNDISVLAIRRYGALRLVSRTPSGGPSPVSLALHGQLLYVANQGDPVFDPGGPSGPLQRIANYTGFRVNRDGTLRALANSTIWLNPGDTPTDILFNKAGDLLAAARVQGRIIDTFRITKFGRLTRAGLLENQPGPFGLIFSPVRENQLFAASFFLPGASSYRVSRGGTLRSISEILDPPGEDNCWTAFSPDGRLLWTASFLPNVLSLFRVDHDGSVEFVSTHREPEPRDSSTVSDIAIDSTGRFLYSLRPFPVELRIHVMRVTDTPEINGGLEDIQDAPLPPFIGADGTDTRGPMGLVIVDDATDSHGDEAN